MGMGWEQELHNYVFFISAKRHWYPKLSPIQIWEISSEKEFLELRETVEVGLDNA